MKKLIIFTLVLLSAYSCIKKNAIKYDPELVGTWVSNDSTVHTWLFVFPDGQGTYETYGNDEATVSGEVKYSVFERKMWVGKKKFKVPLWHTGRLDGVEKVRMKVYHDTAKDTVWRVDKKMILETTGVFSGRSITFYRISAVQ